MNRGKDRRGRHGAGAALLHRIFRKGLGEKG